MKRFSLLTTLVLSLLAVAAAHAMTADELIEKSFEAQGGLEKIKAVKSFETHGLFMVMGMEFPFTMVQTRPNKMRIDADINGAAMVQVWDGESGWSINPMAGSMEPQDMPPMEAKGFEFQADMDGPLVDYAKKGYTVEYIGEDEVEGTAVHHLKIDTHDDLIIDMYFDAEYFLAIKQSGKLMMDEQEIAQDSYMSDFKEVNGLVVPHSIESRMNGQTVNTIMLETIEFDVEIDDAIFVRPAASK